jgi:hypothetical protein
LLNDASLTSDIPPAYSGSPANNSLDRWFARLDVLSGPHLPRRPVNNAVEPICRRDLAHLGEPREGEGR